MSSCYYLDCYPDNNMKTPLSCLFWTTRSYIYFSHHNIQREIFYCSYDQIFDAFALEDAQSILFQIFSNDKTLQVSYSIPQWTRLIYLSWPCAI